MDSLAHILTKLTPLTVKVVRLWELMKLVAPPKSLIRQQNVPAPSHMKGEVMVVAGEQAPPVGVPGVGEGVLLGTTVAGVLLGVTGVTGVPVPQE